MNPERHSVLSTICAAFGIKVKIEGYSKSVIAGSRNCSQATL